MSENHVLLPSLPSTSTEPFHIAFGVDAHYFRGMAVNIASIIVNNPGRAFVFHVFSFTVSDADRSRLAVLAEQYGVAIHVTAVDPDIFSEFTKFPRFGHYTQAIFTRLIIPKAMEGITTRVLYVDADILCMGKIDELAQIDIDGYVLAAVPDDKETTGKIQSAALQLVHKAYFNSGVLYINVDRWIAEDITRKVMQTAVQTELPLSFPDQDALNIVLDGQIAFLEDKWNFRYNMIHDCMAGQPQLRNVDAAVFLHFTSRVKPWHDWSLHDARALFLRYQVLSPWADMPLDPPLNYKEMRFFGLFLFKQKYYARSLLWNLNYVVAKVKVKIALMLSGNAGSSYRKSK
ncbi:glycosyltransferase [Herbaspirillum sp. RTI4]|uniref:glycosyltransferase family 8 protein n=1 Tax=Herbaspirillum sp. RTI4 TaxID=3048640 RepID=UPI002AB3453A|nr:glycosyltransferase [Herbaspirillum sp. RTI4]MDY7580017.1 glycosyltransferase [Herbaspirillum sp. RTI4]MEA9982831.1 glycosyltransferase [Herbaspirillum sp. RTI4]